MRRRKPLGYYIVDQYGQQIGWQRLRKAALEYARQFPNARVEPEYERAA